MLHPAKNHVMTRRQYGRPAGGDAKDHNRDGMMGARKRSPQAQRNAHHAPTDGRPTRGETSPAIAANRRRVRALRLLIQRLIRLPAHLPLPAYLSITHPPACRIASQRIANNVEHSALASGA